jgi:hypothetical protein
VAQIVGALSGMSPQFDQRSHNSKTDSTASPGWAVWELSMAAIRFDALTRTLINADSRRGALRSLLAGTLGLLGWADAQDAPAKKCKKIKNKAKRKKCLARAKGITAGPQPGCPDGTRSCNGACIPAANCCTNADCGAQVCDADGVCRTCTGDAECGTGRKCCVTFGIAACIATSECCTSADCAATEECCPGSPRVCKVATGQICTSAEECCQTGLASRVCDPQTGKTGTRCGVPPGGVCGANSVCCNIVCAGGRCLS